MSSSSPGLELVKLQTPEEHHGINLQILGQMEMGKMGFNQAKWMFYLQKLDFNQEES